VLFAVVTVEVLVTYSRIPSRELYHVSGSGIEGGLSRALVFVNFPVALVALAVLGLIYTRLPGRAYRGVAILAAVLSAAVFWPGIVSQADLDARPVNAVAAIGVLLALVLTGAVASKGGVSRSSWHRADWVRAALALVLLVAALPWLAADLGLYSNGVPLLGRLFQSGQFLPERPGLPNFAPAVHHGHHHGMDGVLLVLTALLLSRRLARRAALPDVLLRRRQLRQRLLDRAGRQTRLDELGDPERDRTARERCLEPDRDRVSGPVGSVGPARRLERR
jgi:hypothetical protein